MHRPLLPLLVPILHPYPEYQGMEVPIWCRRLDTHG